MLIYSLGVPFSNFTLILLFEIDCLRCSKSGLLGSCVIGWGRIPTAARTTRWKAVVDSIKVSAALSMPHTRGVRSTIAPSNVVCIAEVLLVGSVGAVLYQLVHDAWLPAVQEVSVESVANIVHL